MSRANKFLKSSQSKYSLPSFNMTDWERLLELRKQNASERINLQDIMQLRTAFLTADDSGDGELSLKEVRILPAKSVS